MSTSAPGYSGVRAPGRCCATGKVFQEGDLYVASLVELPGAEALERMDFAVEAWEQGQRPQAPARVFGFWRTTHRSGGAPRQSLLSDTELLELFEELAAVTEAKQVSFRYVLALLLVRKRLVRIIQEKEGVLYVLPKGVGLERPPLEVKDPGMDETAVAEAIELLAQVVPPEGEAGAGAAPAKAKGKAKGRGTPGAAKGKA